jgi:pyruvate/2-oxoglutarate dehydrogenase complex dihydrolipoamide dehydrogenase (E3) component
MTTAEQYDAILIGAGQANNPLSTTLAQAGWNVALIEAKHVGGTCVNEGCTPTKTMVASARAAHVARRSSDYGVHTGPVTVDMARVRERKRNVVERFRSGSRRRVEDADGVELLMGQARFVGPKTVAVELNDGETRQLTADKIFINTGQRPRTPDIPGLDAVPDHDSTSIMELGKVPEHLIVVGGGYVGVEFGQMFRRFGAAVTIVQRSDQLLTHEDRDIAEEVAEILREDGLEILLNTDTQSVEQDADGQIRLTVETPAGERVISGSHLLIAAGRVPNTEQLNLEAAGVETSDRGHIKVNERLETNVFSASGGIYALGDVKGGPAFTHIAYDDFRIVRANLLEGGDATTEGRLIPYTVFIDPQLGGVGLTERQARDQGRNVKIAKLPMSHVARAIETDETRGLMKVIVDADTDQLLGAAILGREGGEVMGVLQTAMMGRLPYTALRDTAFAHPTLTESLNNLFMTLED